MSATVPPPSPAPCFFPVINPECLDPEKQIFPEPMARILQIGFQNIDSLLRPYGIREKRRVRDDSHERRLCERAGSPAFAGVAMEPRTHLLGFRLLARSAQLKHLHPEGRHHCSASNSRTISVVTFGESGGQVKYPDLCDGINASRTGCGERAAHEIGGCLSEG